MKNMSIHFTYNKRVNKILIKLLNNDNEYKPLYFICKNELIEINNTIKELNVERCNGSFVMSGNNSLIYFYLPLVLNDSYSIIEENENFELSNINQFFFVPKRNDFNSIKFILTLENKPINYPIFFIYYIEYGIIPYSRNIDKNEIYIRNETNIIIPNYSKYTKENEKDFLFFNFNTTISKIKMKVTYENIIYLEDQTYIFLKPGINIIKFKNNIDHYLNITKFNNNTKTQYSLYKNELLIEKYEINNIYKIIYVE